MIEDGQLFREYQKQVTENQFRLEIYQAEEEYTVRIHCLHLAYVTHLIF